MASQWFSRKRRVGAFGVAALGVVVSACSTPPPPPPPPPTPVVYEDPASLGVNNTFGNDDALGASVSSDERFVAFGSMASNLSAEGGATRGPKLYVRDRETGTVRYAGASSSGRLSANGRFVSFNGHDDPTNIQVYDRVTNLTAQFAPATPAPLLYVSDDGASVVHGEGRILPGTWEPSCAVRELDGSAISTPCPTAPGGFAALRAVSRNTRFVLYAHSAPGVGFGFRLWDRQGAVFVDLPDYGVSFFSQGEFGSAVSDDGRYLLGYTLEGRPVRVDTDLPAAGATTVLPGWNPGPSAPVDMTADGRYVAFRTTQAFAPSDTNGGFDIYVWDTATALVAVASRHLENNSGLPTGADRCILGAGSLSNTGQVCAMTADPMIAADLNGKRDAYVVPWN
jgi:hypothetical protein